MSDEQRVIEPVSAEPMRTSLSWGDLQQPDSSVSTPMPWTRALSSLTSVPTYWVATVHPDGRPHAVPVLGVVVDGAVHFCANERTRKARNLQGDPRIVVTGSSDDFDLVVEGSITIVTGDDTVRKIASAYDAKYGWRPEVHDGALWADGAPTAGPPPYRVHRVIPHTAFCMPTDDEAVATRWRFRPM
ncbi:pyridoxamine 5'-phosphate oxidase family protein [Actinobacteria bacterium YIM 96077]|uniref:Pyridoxamine 5'-phosphate oxidase family protein n=1 Tax=Phytoactinopolyspora halophila TaxID=1981511 RepID=A0A329QLW1_9ACTN|nr:pyridoxamine 5'-phosphate oxidase family protein [Phytoactinopolyspora halophila]AYY12969.1 pyridoxamine 5'-phosphate oxidase family protein [Actinobacteria bacterium YIM 96077]RAW13233.1 pyridoxamine 5'-phosphate oxidase family protein [Phytoactinopolyspora halophila]